MHFPEYQEACSKHNNVLPKSKDPLCQKDVHHYQLSRIFAKSQRSCFRYSNFECVVQTNFNGAIFIALSREKTLYALETCIYTNIKFMQIAELHITWSMGKKHTCLYKIIPSWGRERDLHYKYLGPNIWGCIITHDSNTKPLITNEMGYDDYDRPQFIIKR